MVSRGRNVPLPQVFVQLALAVVPHGVVGQRGEQLVVPAHGLLEAATADGVFGQFEAQLGQDAPHFYILGPQPSGLAHLREGLGVRAAPLVHQPVQREVARRPSAG